MMSNADTLDSPVGIASDLSRYLSLIPRPDDSHNPWVFRGHESVSFQLTPTLFREPTIAPIVKEKNRDKLRDAYTSYIDGFYRDSRPYLKDLDIRRHSQFEHESLARHYGLPSALLDWSANPLVALYFAVRGSVRSAIGASAISAPACVWCLGRARDSSHDDFLLPAPFIDNRIQAQAAFHTRHMRGDDIKWAPLNEYTPLENYKLMRIDVPRNVAHQIEYELYLLGIHEAFVYPGLSGIAGKIAFERYLYESMITRNGELATTSTTTTTACPDYHGCQIWNIGDILGGVDSPPTRLDQQDDGCA